MTESAVFLWRQPELESRQSGPVKSNLSLWRSPHAGSPAWSTRETSPGLMESCCSLLTSSAEVVPVRISQLPEREPDWPVPAPAFSWSRFVLSRRCVQRNGSADTLERRSVHALCFGRMFPNHQPPEKIFLHRSIPRFFFFTGFLSGRFHSFRNSATPLGSNAFNFSRSKATAEYFP